MKFNSNGLIRTAACLLIVVAVTIFLAVKFRFFFKPKAAREPFAPKPVQTLAVASALRTNATSPSESRARLIQLFRKHGGVNRGDFSTQEENEFQAVFAQKIQPAVSNWFNTYGDRMPFPLAAVTADKFVQQFGQLPAFRNYTFVINGITLCVEDRKGAVDVWYLNAPQQTQKLMQMPDGSPPVLTTPVTRADIQAMLLQNTGTQFKAEDIRMTPAGLSGALNGGVIVEVGGDPNNALSWEYNFIFDSSGKLAYYGKGHPK